MGLDMYLEKCKTIVLPNVLHNTDLETLKESENKTDKELYEFLSQYSVQKGEYIHWESLTENVGYWRKANAIHNWFVENVQDGEDNCGIYVVEQEQLEDLLETCEYIVNNAVMEEDQIKDGVTYNNDSGQWEQLYTDGLKIVNTEICRDLPTVEGFFFGGTEYDEFYIEDLQKTIKILKQVLTETDFENETILYQASW